MIGREEMTSIQSLLAKAIKKTEMWSGGLATLFLEGCLGKITICPTHPTNLTK
jgi:hypothetical protein